jgi:chromosome segregation ATPase
LKTCNNVQCPYSKYNCKFSGFKTEVEEHLKTCRYENFKEVLMFYDSKLNTYEETIQELQQTIANKDENIQSLTNYISTLSSRIDNFEKKVEDKFSMSSSQQLF